MKQHHRAIAKCAGICIGLFVALTTLSSCGSYAITQARLLPDPREIPTGTHGAIIRIEGKLEGTRSFDIEGEYLGMVSDSEVVVNTSNGTYSVLTRSATDAVIVLHTNKAEDFGGATLGMTILTLSHGWFLLVTAPATIIAGAMSSSAESTNGEVIAEVIERRVNPLWWFRTTKYARFPQGVPKAAFAPFTRVH